jgi:hypothetical protein
VASAIVDVPPVSRPAATNTGAHGANSQKSGRRVSPTVVRLQSENVTRKRRTVLETTP